MGHEIRFRLRVKRADFGTVVDRNAELLFYKHWQELLQRLHKDLVLGLALDLSVDPQLNDPADCSKQVAEMCARLRDGLALLSPEFEQRAFELKSIDEIEHLGLKLRIAISSGNAGDTWAGLAGLKPLVRQHLARLNGQILELAKQLSLLEMVKDLPDPLEEVKLNVELEHSVRDLTPCVLVRVLLRKIWQEAITECSMLNELLEGSVTNRLQFAEHWYTLKARIQWLATLMPDEAWSKAVNTCAAEVDTELADEKTGGKIKLSFDKFRQTAVLAFSAVLQKLDFGSLGKINPPVKGVLEEIK